MEQNVIITVVIAACMMWGTVLLHYEALSLIWSTAASMHGAPRRKLLLILSGIFAVHWIEIVLYSIAFWFCVDVVHVGTLTGIDLTVPMEYVYFSADTYTSLGFGDIVPVGAIRLLAGTETLNGLILITWSGSFTYLAMERFWTSRKGTHKDPS